MTFLAIVERELRLKARRPRTCGIRCGMVLAFAVISFGVLAVDWLPFKGKTEQASRDDRLQSLAA